MLKNGVYIAVAILTILAVFLTYIKLNKKLNNPTSTLKVTSLKQSVLPSLYTKGNKIVRSDDNQPIILRGVTSDYFRYGFNNNYPAIRLGLKAELKNLDKLKQTGVNIVGLYLADLKQIKLNLNELDTYINYARDNNIYVYLAPVGYSFFETNPNIDLLKDHLGPTDLTQLIELLASRYRNYTNTIYQLAAEPNMNYKDWGTKQKELAGIIRRYTNNLLIVSTPYYSHYLSLPALPFNNVIYQVGGYISKDDSYSPERQVKDIVGEDSLTQKYPVIVGEFGGNYNNNFSSSRDLNLIKQILHEINNRDLSYTFYRLSSQFDNDGLALFDAKGDLTPKGRLFVNYLNRN